jgi:NADPH2:quinone reductase
VLCEQFGPPESLKIGQLPDQKPKPGQVTVSIKAAGVNFPDILMVAGKYQFRPEFPFAPGGEASGIVKEVGEGVRAFKPGDRVIAYLGHGAFAEEVTVEEARLIPMADGMDFVTAAGFVLTYGTSHYALKDRAHLQPGESLLVLGAAGGVGLAAVELGKAMGARVIAAASSDEKLQTCREHGADDVINYSHEDLKDRVKELTGGKGVDVIYDPVGGEYAEPALRTMAWDGRYLVIGFAAGDIPKIPLNLVLLKSCQIVGVFWGASTQRDPEHNQENLRELAQWWQEGKLKPLISATYPLERTVEALKEVQERRVKGKIVITTAA